MESKTVALACFNVIGAYAHVHPGRTQYFGEDDGELIATLPFEAASEKEAEIALNAYQQGHNQGFNSGERTGRRRIVETVHELLGVDAIISAMEISTRSHH